MPTRILILLRHGEAGSQGTSDKLRSLTETGINDSRRVGVVLQTKFGATDLAIVSAATRTRETSAAVLSEFPARKLEFDERLYHASSIADFTALIAHYADEKDLCVLVIGHNPIISSFASLLSGEEVRFSPAEYAILTIEEAHWKTALESSGCWHRLNSY